MKNTSAVVNDYTVSADGKEITLNIGVASSAGYGELLKKCNLQRGELFLLAGGPPCQGFSVQRRGSDTDERNELVLKYGKLIDELYPMYFVMENVTGIAGKRGKTILQQLIEDVEKIGYKVHVDLLDAQDYGVPQRRKRYIIVGERNDLGEHYLWLLKLRHRRYM